LLRGGVLENDGSESPSRFWLAVLYDFGMVLDSASMICQRVVIDDRSRLPGRFFGRFATSATSELTPAA
jgi:hypothetical protein